MERLLSSAYPPRMPQAIPSEAARLAAVRHIRNQLAVLLRIADAAGEDILAAHLSLALETARATQDASRS